MAIVTSYNGRIVVNAIDLSDHAKVIRVNDGHETRDATAHGNTAHNFRPGLGNHSIEATFFNDKSTASVETTLRTLTSITSTGFTVSARSLNSATTAVNPDYQFAAAIIDGDLMVMDDSVGEIPELTVRFVPYSGALVISTTAS